MLDRAGTVGTDVIRVRIAGGACAYPDADVLPRARQVGRGTGVVIGKDIEQHIGELVFELLRHRVDEPQKRPGGRAFLFVRL